MAGTLIGRTGLADSLIMSGVNHEDVMLVSFLKRFEGKCSWVVLSDAHNPLKVGWCRARRSPPIVLLPVGGEERFN